MELRQGVGDHARPALVIINLHLTIAALWFASASLRTSLYLVVVATTSHPGPVTSLVPVTTVAVSAVVLPAVPWMRAGEPR